MALQLIATNGRPGGAGERVDRLRRQLLAGAAFAGDEHRRARRRHAPDLVVDRQHRRRSPDEAGEVGAARPFAGLRRAAASSADAGRQRGDRGLEPLDERLGADRLRQEVDGAALHGGDSGAERPVGAGGDQRAPFMSATGAGAADGVEIGNDDRARFRA